MTRFPQDKSLFIKYPLHSLRKRRSASGLNRHHALQNCTARPGERFHNSTNGLIKWNHRHQNSQMARERCACTPFLRRASLGSPSPYPIPIHPRNLLFVLTVNVVSALWNSLISQILPNNFRVTRHWIAFPRPVITKIPNASVSSFPPRRLRRLRHFRYGWKNFLQVAHTRGKCCNASFYLFLFN